MYTSRRLWQNCRSGQNWVRGGVKMVNKYGQLDFTTRDVGPQVRVELFLLFVVISWFLRAFILFWLCWRDTTLARLGVRSESWSETMIVTFNDKRFDLAFWQLGWIPFVKISTSTILVIYSPTRCHWQCQVGQDRARVISRPKRRSLILQTGSLDNYIKIRWFQIHTVNIPNI